MKGKAIPIEEIHYSTDEQLIGTFLGKDLYRRCVDIGDGSSYGLTFNGTAQDVPIPFGTLLGFNSNYEVVSFDTKAFRIDGGVAYFNNNFTISSNGILCAYYVSSALQGHVYFGTQYNNSRNRGVMKIVLCVEYTKERIW